MQMTIAELGLSGRSDDECASKIGLPLDGCFEALYPDESKETIMQCADAYRRIFQENLLTMKPQVFPKVIETLSALKEKGYTLTIASSRWHKSLSELTNDLKIADYISYLVGADFLNDLHPSPKNNKKGGLLTVFTKKRSEKSQNIWQNKIKCLPLHPTNLTTLPVDQRTRVRLFCFNEYRL